MEACHITGFGNNERNNVCSGLQRHYEALSIERVFFGAFVT